MIDKIDKYENIIILSVIVIIGIIIFKSNNDIKRISYDNKDLNRISHDSDYIESNKICPLMNLKTIYTSCIQNPSDGKGYIISTCCKGCISKIQSELKNVNSDYKIIQIGEKYYFNYKGENKQEIKECNKKNIEYITGIIGTKLTST